MFKICYIELNIDKIFFFNMELMLKMSHEIVERIYTPSMSIAIPHNSVPCDAAAAARSKNESYWNSWAVQQEKMLHCCSSEVYIEISSS